jgi:transposase
MTRQRHAEVHALSGKGVGTTAIGKALNLDHKTVLRYARAATAEELITQVSRRGSDLDAYTDYLAQRWQEGCVNAARLTEEVRSRGYRGSERSVRRLLQSWRSGEIRPSAMPVTTHTPRDVTGWMIRPTAELTDQERSDLAGVLDRCPELRTVNQLVGDFAGMVRELRGQHLDSWISKAHASGITHLSGFADGLRAWPPAIRPPMQTRPGR